MLSFSYPNKLKVSCRRSNKKQNFKVHSFLANGLILNLAATPAASSAVGRRRPAWSGTPKAAAIPAEAGGRKVPKARAAKATPEARNRDASVLEAKVRPMTKMLRRKRTFSATTCPSGSSWGCICSLQVAALVPDVACSVVIGEKTFSASQSNPAYIWKKCCHLRIRLLQMEPNWTC